MQEQLNNILIEIRSAWRFRWPALGVAWLVSLAGWVVVAAMPDVYEARTRVFVDSTSQVRRILGEQIIEPDLDTQLNFVRQSLLGQVALESIVTEVGLATGAETRDELNEIIESVGNRIQVGISDTRAPAGNNSYTLIYTDTERSRALAVVEALRSIFIEDTLGTRLEGAEIARGFFRDQVDKARADLETAEDALATFRRENIDVLPGNEGGYIALLQRVRAELQDDIAEQDRLESVRSRVLEQLRGERAAASGPRAPGEVIPNSLEARINELESQRDLELLKYREGHPIVIALDENIARLEAELETQQQAADLNGTEPALDDVVYEQLQMSLYEVEADLESVVVKVRRGEAEMLRLRALMEEVPEVEAEEARLLRDVDAARARYNAALSGLETERLTREATETDQVNFRSIDPPSASPNPVEPKRPLLLAGVLAAGLAAGGGLAFLLSQARPVFPNPGLLRAVSGLPVLGAVSMTWKERTATRRRIALLSYSVACFSLFLVFGGVFLFEVVGPGFRSLVS